MGLPSTYYRFSTRGLAEIMLLGWVVIKETKSSAPKTRSIVVITDELDDSVNEKIFDGVADDWRGQPDDEIVIEAGRFLKDMERNIRKQHDVDLDDYLVGREMFDHAFAAMEGRKWQEALDGFKECIRKIKNHSQSYGNMGICLAMLGQREKSLEAFNKALEIDPSYEPAMNNRALVENLKDGERLAEDKFYSVDYSKEKFERNKKRD